MRDNEVHHYISLNHIPMAWSWPIALDIVWMALVVTWASDMLVDAQTGEESWWWFALSVAVIIGGVVMTALDIQTLIWRVINAHWRYEKDGRI